MSIKKIKYILFFSISIILLIIFVTIYTYKTTNKSLEQRSFEIRTKKTLIELDNLISNNYEQLIFEKSVFLFGNIIHISNSNFKVDSTFCANLNNDFEQKIIQTIEKRIRLEDNKKETFSKNMKYLRNECKIK